MEMDFDTPIYHCAPLVVGVAAAAAAAGAVCSRQQRASLWLVRVRQSTLSALQRVIPSCNCRWPHNHLLVLTGSLELVSAPSTNNLAFMLSPCPIVQPEPLKNS